MKKLLVLFVSALLLFGYSQAGAEMTSPMYDGTYKSLQTYSMVYNVTGGEISSNTVVVFSTLWSAFEGTNVGTYATYPSVTAAVAVIGVADEDIASGKVGRVCIRGPHRVRVHSVDTTMSTWPDSTGDIVVTALGSPDLITAGVDKKGCVSFASMTSAFITDLASSEKYGTIGRRLGDDATNAATNSTNDLIWIWVNPQEHLLNYGI